jgi:hypothetical protein
MTNEKIKETLLSIEDSAVDFSVTQSGKRSKKVHGLYKPDTREIIIHNKNFEKPGGVDENQLLYTAIHEYAHHQHACLRGGTLSARAHSSEFWAIFHELLGKAEAKDIYKNAFNESRELRELTGKIRENYLKPSGELLKEFGALLMQAYDLCGKEGLRFEDYVDRVLCIPRTASKLALNINGLDIKSETGVDNMKFLAGIRNKDARAEAQESLLSGKSPDSVKAALKKQAARPVDKRTMLEKEKARLERTIQTLENRLTAIEQELSQPQNTAAYPKEAL